MIVFVSRAYTTSFVLAAVVAIGVLSGCGGSPQAKAPETSSAPASTPAVEAPAPETPAPAAAPASAESIAACTNMVEWYRVNAAYAESGASDPAVTAALAAKEAELLAAKPPVLVNDKLELVAFDWKLKGTKSAEGKAELFTASWLFRKTQDTALGADRAVFLVLRGWVDKAHQQYLKDAGIADGRYFEKTYEFDPGLDSWPVGKYTLITKEIKPALPNLPYRMHSIFPAKKKGEDGNWASDGKFAEALEMGWFADLGK